METLSRRLLGGRLLRNLLPGQAGAHCFLIFTHTSRRLIRDFWILYFGLDEDYTTLCRNFCTDPVLCRAVRFAPGIRLLRQDPWETLCSFYHQSKQQYPSHSRHYRAVCSLLGDPMEKGPPAFPTPERLSSCTIEDLAPLRSGFPGQVPSGCGAKSVFRRCQSKKPSIHWIVTMPDGS